MASAWLGSAMPATGQPAPAPAPPATAPAAIDPVKLSQTLRKQDEDLLLRAAKTQTERDDAARRLAARQGDASVTILQAALEAANNPPAQLAAARALAEDPTPDRRLIDPLSRLLGGDAQTTTAAASALVNYRDPAVDRRVHAYAQDTAQPPTARAAAARALGGALDKASAAVLVSLLQNDRESVVRNVAADALAEMTLHRDFGRDVQAWQQWWAENQGKSNAQFKADLAERWRRHRPAPPDLDLLIEDLYQMAAEPQKTDVLRRLLNSPDPAIRAAGARQFRKVVLGTGRIPDNTLPRLRELLHDWAPEVRIEAARVLGRISDRASLEPLLVQVREDPDPTARAAMAAALELMQDPRAVPALLDLLNDPSIRVATVAAETLAKLGPVIRQDPALSARVVQALRATINGRGVQPAGAELRAAAIEALVPLAPTDPTLGRSFLELLNPRETPRTRRAAVQGVGVAGDRRLVDALIAWLPQEQDATVRLSTLGAVAQIGTFDFADSVYAYTQPNVEPDASVRDTAWGTFQKLLPSATEQQLIDWADRRFLQDPARRLPVLQELARRHETANKPDDLAAARQNIGDALLKLNRPADAIGYFRPALEHWDARGANALTVAVIVKGLMDAYLASGRYADAVAFAQERITKDPRQTAEVAAPMILEAERLIAARKPADALRIMTEMEKLQPPLGPPYDKRMVGIKRTANEMLAAPPPR